MNKLNRRFDALSVKMEQANSFLSQETDLMREALEADLTKQENLNTIIATFEELRNRARNCIELRKMYELLKEVQTYGEGGRTR